MSPDSRDIANYEDYIRRELPRLVRSNIEEAVRREMQPLEASLIINIDYPRGTRFSGEFADTIK